MLLLTKFVVHEVLPVGIRGRGEALCLQDEVGDFAQNALTCVAVCDIGCDLLQRVEGDAALGADEDGAELQSAEVIIVIADIDPDGRAADLARDVAQHALEQSVFVGNIQVDPIWRDPQVQDEALVDDLIGTTGDEMNGDPCSLKEAHSHAVGDMEGFRDARGADE